MHHQVALEGSGRCETQQHGWVRHKLPDEVGECHTDSLTISPDFSLLRTSYRPRQALAEESLKQLERPVLAVTLGLTGESRFRGRCGTELAFRSGCTTVSAFRCTRGERLYPCGKGVKQLRLLVGEYALRHYLGDAGCRQLLDGRNGVRQLAHHRTTQASLAHAGALLWQIDEAPADILQTHIHILGLLAEELRHLDLQLKDREQRLCRRDTGKTDEARLFLQANMGRHLTVGELAAAVGINESKLRAGFRQRYNKSPCRLLLELRMQKAWQLLETGCQVAEAAYAVGYEHPSNFSAAFTRFFACAPKSVFGQRRSG